MTEPHRETETPVSQSPSARLPGPDASLTSLRQWWDPEHPVLDILRRRREARSTPGAREDPHKVALAVEGGGMRGAISAAALSALEDFGMTNAFDVVYGISAGAVNAAYFLTGSTWINLSIYYDNLTSKKFLDIRRPLRGQDLMDINYAYDEVVRITKPLDYQAVLTSSIPLVIGMTDVDSIALDHVRDFESADDLHAALRASAWLPVALKGTAFYKNRRKVDGGVLAMSPRLMAARDGATHTLSLSTKPVDVIRGKETLAVAAVVMYLNHIQPGLGHAYRDNLSYFRKERESLIKSRTSPGSEPPFVLDLAPGPETPEVSRHEQRPWKLLSAMRAAYTDTWAAIEGLSRESVISQGWATYPRLTLADRNRSTRP